MFKIDDNIPMPPRAHGDFAATADALEVGQSFFAPGVVTGSVGTRTARQRKAGKRFASRRATEGGIDGSRIWRIA